MSHKKLAELTADQSALIPVVRQRWLDRVFKDHSFEKQKALEGINWLYSLTGLPSPIVVFLDSPMACQIGANLRDQVGDQVGAQVRAQVWAQVRDQVWDQVGDQVGDQVRAQVWDQVWDQVGDQVRAQVWAQVRAQVRAQVWDQVGDQVGDQVRAQVWDQVWDQVGDQVRDQVGDQVRAQVRAQVGDQKLQYFDALFWDLLYDAGWVAFYDFFDTIGIKVTENFRRYREYIDTGVVYLITLRGIAFVCIQMVDIQRDERNRLHNATGPAILWADGWQQYFWHGVRVPAKLIKSPDGYSRDDFLRDTNAEVRRAVVEILGPDRFAKLLDLEAIDEGWYDAVHPDGRVTHELCRLHRTREIDPVAGEHIQFVEVGDLSTTRVYYLCTRPGIQTALEARASTFPLPEGTKFAPEMES